MPTQDIERLIADLQRGQAELARRDSEHDEHITILLGQVVTLVPEVRILKEQLNEFRAEQKEFNARMDMRLDTITAQLALVLQKLDERK